MTIQRLRRPVAPSRISTIARTLLDASTLCSIATVKPGGRAHINTAYFASNPAFDLFWLSYPSAGHSRNVRDNPSAAVSVYDSTQSWGGPDRGVQLFGSAREVSRQEGAEAARAYAARFPAHVAGEMLAYRLYRFRPRTLKLFDEVALGAGVFVTATVGASGAVTWRRTEIYRAHLQQSPRRGVSRLPPVPTA